MKVIHDLAKGSLISKLAFSVLLKASFCGTNKINNIGSRVQQVSTCLAIHKGGFRLF